MIKEREPKVKRNRVSWKEN